MADLIDRQQAIDAVMELFKRVPTNAIRAKKVIEKLPSAQPELTQIFETRAIPSDDDRVSLSETVTATYYDEEKEEWQRKTVTVRDVLDSVCDEYTVLPSEQPDVATDINVGDTISRQQAIDEIRMCDYGLESWQKWKLTTMLKDIPSAQPERKGHWVYAGTDFHTGDDWYTCSECEAIDEHYMSPYCWHCGCRMEGEQE